MCGIAGIYGRGDVRAMTRRLAHRGPDQEGFFETGPIHLGVCRLAVIDREGGRQPLCAAEGGHWIAFSGELFNYLELRAELEGRGHRFRTRSDTEVALAAYQEWGETCLNRFIGMFAFAVWNGHKLFLARDRFGEKPLFYARAGERFLFASEIKALLTEVPAEAQVDGSFAVLETALEPRTLFKGIYALEPAHYLEFDGQDLRTRRYWELPEGPAEPRPLDELGDELLALLRDAVRLRLRADVPVGLYLSGGLDSSLLAALARPAKVFTCQVPYGPAFAEGTYAREVADALGAEQLEVTLTPQQFQREYPRIVWHLEQPLSTTSSAGEFILARLASEHVKVVVGGQGADEAFGGYVRYVLLSEEQRLAGAALLREYHPLARLLWGHGAFGPPADRYFRLLQRGFGSGEPLRRARVAFARQRSLVNGMGAVDFLLTLPALLAMNDRAAAAHGLENRTPYLDHRVVEFAFRLPPEAKIQGLTTKVLLRRVARGLVPDAVVERPDKKGFGLPIQRWLRNELRDWSQELVEALRRRGIDWRSAGERGDFDRTLFTKLSLELWFRTFVDNGARGPVA